MMSITYEATENKHVDYVPPTYIELGLNYLSAVLAPKFSFM